ncbi:MAG: hypothetical protein KF830_08845 [Planctomycetes bacterium]|nr:hypothetical protein [Planctomycetota bacterium]
MTHVDRARWLRLLVAVAVAVLGAAFGWRHVESHDIGYHLAYGQDLGRHGWPVDDARFVYPTLGGSGAPQPEAGPGNWYDADGRYRFPNANWLSQALLAAAHAVAGDLGLSALVAALAAGIAVVAFLGLGAHGLGPAGAGAATVALLLLVGWRLEPRPEVFGYLVLGVQTALLLATAGRGRVVPRRTFAALVLLQVLLVNLHSYFLLGLGAAAAMWLQALLRPASQPPAARRRLGALLGAMALAGFANPWTWRLALLPVQTVLYLRRHGIADPEHVPPHPWSAIEEFRPLPLPWQDAPWDLPLLLFHLLLGAAAAAVLTALVRRRFDLAALLTLGSLTALSMRRNVPPAAMLLVPAIAAALAPWRPRTGERAAPRTAIAVAGVALALAASLATGTFHAWTGSRAQFGGGFSPLHLPLGVARWLDEQAPAGRLWTDFNLSSNVHFLAGARPEVPLLTNTWAMPPEAMRLVLDRLAGAPFAEAAALGIEVVALETDTTAAPMVQQLARDRAWTLVHVEPRHAVFLRTHGANAALAARCRAREEQFDPEAWRRPWSRWPGLERQALRASVGTFERIGWNEALLQIGEPLLDALPDDAWLWGAVGGGRARRGLERLRRGDVDGGRAELGRAEAALARALALRPGSPAVERNLATVRQALAHPAGR